MTEAPVVPPRPEPSRQLGDTAGAWLAWFGPGRLALSAGSVIVVALGVFWLVRTPSPPTEAGLPFTVGATTTSGGDATAAPSPTAAPATAPSASSVVVHVAGSVARAGVYELDAGARVDSAIAAAGGATSDAELDGLNLASVLIDGQRVYVPADGEVDPATVPSGGVAAGDQAGETQLPSEPIDLNVATAAQLETLPGIGPATAAAIVDDRDRHGPFASVAELERVPGIGPAKLAVVVDLVTV